MFPLNIFEASNGTWRSRRSPLIIVTPFSVTTFSKSLEPSTLPPVETAISTTIEPGIMRSKTFFSIRRGALRPNTLAVVITILERSQTLA